MKGASLLDHQPIIGIECHVQLDTSTKLFCNCEIQEGASPNTAICEVCTGQPGALPAINKKAISLGIRAGLALGCDLQTTSVFARKNYFYPDLPKGYQISQFDKPLCTGGHVHAEIDGITQQFALTRIHLEEDAGKLIHDPSSSRVDWNRAGRGLAEIVSEPVIRGPREAVAYMRSLHRTMVAAGVCRGDMEKGHMRFDVNVSVHRPNQPLGTRVEIKNLNSFRFASKAISEEIQRQIDILNRGGTIQAHTRGWTGTRSVPLREKEAAADYRYFPDPDLPRLQIHPEEIESARAALPACPLDKHLIDRDRKSIQDWCTRYGLNEATVSKIQADAQVAAFFEACVAAGGVPFEMANWVQTEFLRALKSTEGQWALVALQPTHLVELQAHVENGKLSHTAAKKVFEALFHHGGDVSSHIQSMGLEQVGDERMLQKAVDSVLAQYPDECQSYRNGKHKILGFLMGQLMRETRGAADPSLLKKILLQALQGNS